MTTTTLKLRDGFPDTSPNLRNQVKKLQKALLSAGYQVDQDGLFGEGTEKAVKAFQQARDLEADGIVGPKTWRALGEKQSSTQASPDPPLLPGFRGDLKWVHEREGYAGKAYWPGGASGVTIDPGVDLGYAKPELVEDAYKEILRPVQLEQARLLFGIRGEEARKALKSNPIIQNIRISKTEADTVFPYAAAPYWRDITGRFPTLMNSGTLSSVQTALLSLSYNRGAHNRALESLRQPLENSDWPEVAAVIGGMQQNHRLKGIRKRRQMEAELICSQIRFPSGESDSA